jgi:Mrp family chromosome partitioning ATPase
MFTFTYQRPRFGFDPVPATPSAPPPGAEIPPEPVSEQPAQTVSEHSAVAVSEDPPVSDPPAEPVPEVTAAPTVEEAQAEAEINETAAPADESGEAVSASASEGQDDPAEGPDSPEPVAVPSTDSTRPDEPEPAPVGEDPPDSDAHDQVEAPPPRYAVPALRQDTIDLGPDLRFPLEMRALERRIEQLWQTLICPVLAVTGASVGAGATTVSLALARHLSGRGKRVLLCGDTARVREAIPTPRPRSLPIDVITLPYLTAVNKLERWLASLKPRFDIMLLDLASPARSPDSACLLPMTDGVTLVVRADQSRTREIDEAVDAILEAGATPLGFVFNGRAREPRRFGRHRTAA